MAGGMQLNTVRVLFEADVNVVGMLPKKTVILNNWK